MRKIVAALAVAALLAAVSFVPSAAAQSGYPFGYGYGYLYQGGQSATLFGHPDS